MVHIFLEDWAKALLLLHGLASVVLIGMSGHLAWHAMKGTLRGLDRRIPWLVASYLVTFVSGLFIYPTCRYYVRALYFEPQMRSVNFYFEVKEHLSALGLALLLVYWLLNKSGEEPPLRRFRRVTASALFLIVAYSYVVSLILNNLKGL